MEVTFAPKDILQIDNARIIFRNFSGAPSKFNREGDRNFSVIIDDEEMAQRLVNDGWNVKIKPPREDGDSPFMHLPVKVKFGDYPPKIYLLSGNNLTRLDEESASCIDDIDIESVDLDIRPYHWAMSDGKTGVTAYLQSMRVTQKIDRFAAEEYEKSSL